MHRLFSRSAILTRGQAPQFMSFYSFKVDDIRGKEFDLETLKGKVVLVVNTASKCGFTPQLQGLEELHKKYEKDGLVVIGFPSNTFNQEVGKDEIEGFCQRNYGVSFKIMDKIEVNGDKEHPLYGFMKAQKRNAVGLKRIIWNFEKVISVDIVFN